MIKKEDYVRLQEMAYEMYDILLLNGLKEIKISMTDDSNLTDKNRKAKIEVKQHKFHCEPYIRSSEYFFSRNDQESFKWDYDNFLIDDYEFLLSYLKRVKK